MPRLLTLFPTNPRCSEHKRRIHRKLSLLSPERLERLRASAKVHRAWEKSTGPRTIQGRFRSAQNGRVRQRGELSVRELRAELANVFVITKEMTAARRSLM
jgi:hypothetical protein